MKKLKFIIAAFASMCIAANSQAQTPQAIKYQTVARNSSGDLIENQNVSFRISILKGSEKGASVYEEIQPATTNQFGLANISIGNGNAVTGVFDSIKWGNDTYFVKVEFDPQGGSNFAFMGTSQLLSVPYSLYAEHAKFADNMPVFPIKAALQGTDVSAPFNNPETGMLVYNTDSNGKSPNNVVPGYYYNAGTSNNPNWILLGNASHDSKVTVFPTATATSNNTTYGGLSQDQTGGTVGNAVGSGGAGYDNTAFGFNAFNSNTTGSRNTSVGAVSLYSNTTGNYNVAIGDSAMRRNMTGSSNTAVGTFALATDSTQSGNIAIGDSALYTEAYPTAFNSANIAIGNSSLWSNKPAATSNSGSQNTAIGQLSMRGNTTGYNNTGVGYSVSFNTTTGNDNTVMGNEALYSNITGNDNVALGYVALYSNTATGNTGVGDSALYSNTSGTANTALGYDAANGGVTASNVTAVGYDALVNSTGSGNVAVGTSAFNANTSAGDGTAVGYVALYQNTTGADNTADGAGALYQNTTGSDNTSVGYHGLFNNVTGGSNTGIGYNAGPSSSALTNTTAIGNGASATASNTAVIGNSSLTTLNLGAGAYAAPVQESTATSGTVTANGSQFLNLTGAATGLTITDPSSPVEGQLWEITTNQTSITLTFTASHFVSAPATVTKTAPARFYYSTTLSKWVNM